MFRLMSDLVPIQAIPWPTFPGTGALGLGGKDSNIF